MGVIKVFFHPNVKIDMAIAQITAICQATVKGLPPGITPPLIITYNASSVPILQLSLSSKTLSESQVNDLGVNFLRVGLATVPGCRHAQSLWRQNAPDHGGYRHFRLEWSGAFPQRCGQRHWRGKPDSSGWNGKNWQHSEYAVELNGSPDTIQELNDIPLKVSQWPHDLHPGRGARARRVRRPAEYRAQRRRPRIAADDHQSRRRFHAGYCGAHQKSGASSR